MEQARQMMLQWYKYAIMFSYFILKCLDCCSLSSDLGFTVQLLLHCNSNNNNNNDKNNRTHKINESKIYKSIMYFKKHGPEMRFTSVHSQRLFVILAQWK